MRSRRGQAHAFAAEAHAGVEHAQGGTVPALGSGSTDSASWAWAAPALQREAAGDREGSQTGGTRTATGETEG